MKNICVSPYKIVNEIIETPFQTLYNIKYFHKIVERLQGKVTNLLPNATKLSKMMSHSQFSSKFNQQKMKLGSFFIICKPTFQVANETLELLFI